MQPNGAPRFLFKFRIDLIYFKITWIEFFITYCPSSIYLYISNRLSLIFFPSPPEKTLCHWIIFGDVLFLTPLKAKILSPFQIHRSPKVHVLGKNDGTAKSRTKESLFYQCLFVELLPIYGTCKNDNLKILKSLPKPLGQLQTNWKEVLFFSKKGGRLQQKCKNTFVTCCMKFFTEPLVQLQKKPFLYKWWILN